LLRMASSLVRQAGLNARWPTSCRYAPALRALLRLGSTCEVVAN
jgi:hypothetical protein